jgi:excinuclease ABC subunit A
MQKLIKVIGARENNLKNVHVNIPRDSFVVITGVSGSGKSSLAFDTIYAEGQRGYVESLSTHARQLLNQMNKPDVDSIEGLSPAISIQQRVSHGSPRSTVGTTTEIYDYMRVLFARVGKPHCPKCDKPINSQTSQEIVDQMFRTQPGKLVHILSPVVKNKKGSFEKLLKEMQSSGFNRARIDGKMFMLNAPISLQSALTHDIDVVIDRILISEETKSRIAESVSTALSMGKGVMSALFGDKNEEEKIFSALNACTDCGISLGAINPGMFSFNSPYGACEMCHGLGTIELLDYDLMVVDDIKSVNEGAVPLITHEDVPMIAFNRRLLDAVASKFKIDLTKPWKILPEKQQRILLNGSTEATLKIPYWKDGQQKFKESIFEGFRKIFFDRYHEAQQNLPKEIIKRYMSSGPCISCKGRRLRAESLAVRLDTYNIIDFTQQSLDKLQKMLHGLKLSPMQEIISKDLIREIQTRVTFMIEVGLGYLTLARTSNTLAGGEAQRIKLATQIGSGLMGVLYVLDEPSIGLHQRDNDRLLKSLKNLQEIGNSVIVVEHDEATIRAGEHLIEMGPGAGTHGGNLVFQGTLSEMLAYPDSITGKYLRREVKMPVPEKRRPINPKNMLTLSGCTENNLQNLTLSFPLNCFITASGVSGSGKSSLINKTLHKALQQKLTRSKVQSGIYKTLTGYQNLSSVVEINQSSIGRTPRSNPATYTGLFDMIRDWYADLSEAKIRGLKPSHFSFNVRGGRCEACSGDGIKRIEMHFLPDVYVPCEVCKGARYDREILEVKYKNKSISDILNATVEEVAIDFKNVSTIYEKLKLLEEVGLSYIKLGQSATTLSGGEAQRIKLASELDNRTKGHTVYILDEPTTGLHFADIHKLLEVLQKLVNYGHTVIVIEHNLEVIYASDYVIDLGPDGGDKGGYLVAAGTPEEIMQVPESHTGRYLKKHVAENVRSAD